MLRLNENLSFFISPLWGSRVFLVLLMALVVTGCMSKAPGTVKRAGDELQPDWILNTPVERGFLYGVGAAEIFGGNDASALSRAKDMARVELVKQVEVQVSGEVEQEIEEVTRNESTQLTEKLRQSVKSRVPEFKLSQVTGVDSYKDDKGKRVTVMVRLDVMKELQSLGQQIASLDEQLADYAQKLAQTPPGGMSTLRVVSPALVLSEQRAGLQARYNALEPSKKTAPLLSPEIRDLLSQIYQRIAQLKISVKAEDRAARSLQTGLIAQLTKRGLQISESGQGDIQIVYNLHVNTVSRGGTHFAITEGDIWIKDEAGRVVRALQAKAKGTSVDPEEARSRSIAKLSGQLGKALLEALF